MIYFEVSLVSHLTLLGHRYDHPILIPNLMFDRFVYGAAL